MGTPTTRWAAGRYGAADDDELSDAALSDAARSLDAASLDNAEEEEEAGEEEAGEAGERLRTTREELKRVAAATRRGLRARRRKRPHDIAPDAQGPPQSLSLGLILSQALIARDTQLLDEVLHRGVDLLVIRRSLLDLESHLVPRLIHELTQRTLKNNARFMQLGPWIRELLRQHAGFLVGIFKQNSDLAILHEHSRERLRMAPNVALLLGRVDAVLARRNEVLQVETCGENPDERQRPLLHFVEGVN